MKRDCLLAGLLLRSLCLPNDEKLAACLIPPPFLLQSTLHWMPSTWSISWYLTVSLYPTCEELGRVLRSTNKPTTHPFTWHWLPSSTLRPNLRTEVYLSCCLLVYGCCNVCYWVRTYWHVELGTMARTTGHGLIGTHGLWGTETM